MQVVVAFILTLLIITVCSILLATGCGILFMLNVLRADPTVIMKWDKARFREEEMKQPKLAEATSIFFALAFWYINLPRFLYHRYVKKNKSATLTDPRGDE